MANQDIDEIIAYYLSESAELAAFGFIDALEEAYTHISRHPATGPPRYAHELDLTGLRFWPLTPPATPHCRPPHLHHKYTFVYKM
jgi:toxin ParE1/3/4